MSTQQVTLADGQRATLINPEWDNNTPCIPTAVQTPSGPHKITISEARAHLDKVRHYCITKSPGFASIAASVKHVVLTPASNHFKHVAFTDGWKVWYGGGFFQEAVRAQSAIVIHEVLHVALRHPQRALKFYKNTGHPYGGKNFNPKVWNIAADCIVNLATFDLKWVDAPKCGLVKFETVMSEEILKQWPPHRWNLEKLYIQLMRASEQGSGNKQEQLEKLIKKISDALADARGDGNSPDPDTLLGDISAAMGEVREDTDAESRNWSSRVERAAAGDHPDGMMRKALFDLPTTNTPWQTILRRWLTAHVLPTTEPHVFKPSRLMLSQAAYGKKRGYRVHFDPGIQPAKGVKRIVVCIDTSGSIGDDVLNHFCAEIQTIRRKVGADVVLIACDAAVHKIMEVAKHENLYQKVKANGGGFGGGGGTDFRPAVEEANKVPGAAVCIYLTDMMGPFPEESKIPLIWAATMDCHQPPPVGRVISIMDN